MVILQTSPGDINPNANGFKFEASENMTYPTAPFTAKYSS